jgi:hypothetical protein
MTFRGQAITVRLDLSFVIIALVLVTPLSSACNGEPTDQGSPPLIDLIINGGWWPTVLEETASYVTFTWDDLVSHSGGRSVSIAIDEEHPVESTAYNWYQITTVGFDIGATYELSAWIRPEQLSATAWIAIQFWSASDSIIGVASTQVAYDIKGTSDWRHVNGTFSVPDGTTRILTRAGIHTPQNAGGTAWFDDISLVRIST